MAGQPGNANAVTHGLRMPLSKLPAGCHYIDMSVGELRRALENLTLEVRGTLGTYERLCVQSACRWEKHSQLCSRWLRLADGELTHGERLAYSREVARASAERDKCLERLGLDERDTGNAFDALYGPQHVAHGPDGEPDSEHSDTQDNATSEA